MLFVFSQEGLCASQHPRIGLLVWGIFLGGRDRLRVGGSAGGAGSSRQLRIVLVQDPEAMDVLGLPRLFLAAKVQDGRVLHDPFQVAGPSAAQQVAAVVARIVIPQHILQGKDALAKHRIEHILIRQDQLLAVQRHVAEQRLRLDLPPSGLQIHQDHAGVVIAMLNPQAQLVDVVGQLRLSGVGRGGKEIALEIRFP